MSWAPKMETWRYRSELYYALERRFPRLMVLVYTTDKVGDTDMLLVEVRGTRSRLDTKLYSELVPADDYVLDEIITRIELVTGGNPER